MREISQIYDADVEREWSRLTSSPCNCLEFIVFMHHLEGFLPRHGQALDAGGGPGRYAVELCKRGLDVTLLDLSSRCIEFAKGKIRELDAKVQHHLREYVVGDVRDLSRFPDETFDVVLCLDPLSCMAQSTDREQALSELVRVAKTGAPVALAVRGYLAVLCTLVRVAGDELLDDRLDTLMRTGNCNVGGMPHHFFRATEIRDLAEGFGLETMLQAGGEGLSSNMPEATVAIAEAPDQWKRWTDVVIATSTEPAVVDTSGHMLYVGRKE